MSTVEEDKAGEAQDELEALQPSAQERYITVGNTEVGQLTFVQRPLSFFGKMEFFAVVGGAINELVTGEDAISIEDLMPQGRETTVDDVKDVTAFAGAFMRVIEEVPELLQDIYCIALGVPKGRRDLVKSMMSAPEAEGGLSDDDGFGVLETFIEQNGEVLTRLFAERIEPLFRRVQARFGSQQSAPSNRTQRRTRRR